MSTEDDRSVPSDLFSAAPAAPHQFAPAGTGGAAHPLPPVPRAYAPRPVPYGGKKARLWRRILPYVAVVWGGLTVVIAVVTALTAANGYALSGNGYYRAGQLLGFVLAIAMVVGGSREISSQHLRRVRYLPWLVAFETAALIIAIGVPLALQNHRYPASLRAGLMRGCEAHGGDASYCGCVLNWFESNRSLSQFMEEFTDDANAAATEASRSDMSAASASCRG